MISVVISPGVENREVSYAELRRGDDIRARLSLLRFQATVGPMIAGILKEWILSGEFLLSKPVFTLPCDERELIW